jgi:hypothetical protein
MCYVVPTPVHGESLVDMTGYGCLDHMEVRPVTSLVRRHLMSQDVAAQMTISEVQQRYRKNSMKAKKTDFKEIKSLSDYRE